jgi:hypothetical protein
MNGISLAKFLILIGAAIISIGVLLLIGSKLGLGFGKFPGDIKMKGEKTTVYFPIVTMLIVSFVLTVILNIILWIFRK